MAQQSQSGARPAPNRGETAQQAMCVRPRTSGLLLLPANELIVLEVDVPLLQAQRRAALTVIDAHILRQDTQSALVIQREGNGASC